MWNRVGAPLLGRERESGSLERLLVEHRAVTVVGGAGVGKSRLAADTLAAMTGGPWQRVVRVRWDGHGRATPGVLASEVCQALTGRRPRREADVGGLAGQLPGPCPRVLLFLDDVDPVHAECTGVVQRLLMAVPTLRVLVTSRRALGLGDERVLRLAPLSTEVAPGETAGDERTGSGPAGDERTGNGPAGDEPAGARGRAPAVELFLARARAVVRDFRADDAALRDVAAICRAVEGVPLAIELAARQVTQYPVGQLAELVERRQCWLSNPHAAIRRHRSLRDAVGASYVLGERAVRAVWGRASVFAGDFEESTAVFVCAGGGVEPHQVPGCLAQLAAMAVLEPVCDPGGLRRPRYRMTRAARDFGAERLAEAGEFAVAAERRTLHCQRVAAVAESLWSAGCQSQAVRLVQAEQDDLRTLVHEAPTRADDAAAALEAVLNLWFWWAVHDTAEEGRGLLLRLLPRCPPDSPLVARGLWLAAWLTAVSDPREARDLLGRAWPAAVLAGDDATVGRIAHVQGVLALHRGDERAAAAHFQEAARTIPATAPGGPAPAVSLAALALAQSGFAPGAAWASARRALAQPGIEGDAWACVVARYARAYVDHQQGRSGRAWHRARRVLAALDESLPAPCGVVALRQLIADIEAGAGAHGRAPRLTLPRARTATPSPVLAGIATAR
ncbi:ATP-binding protein [Streptomyces apocyni]|uniref:ATP-binding protein n=1 Tax=Streptomyces apocyni TaxID=2654677 RepID=UPI0012EAF36B|nr:hypothetical protein [Streptomyces apocyni]